MTGIRDERIPLDREGLHQLADAFAADGIAGAASLLNAGAATPPREIAYVQLGTNAMPSLAAEARMRRDEVRAAFEEGCKIGGQGFMPEAEIAKAWSYSRASRELAGPGGRNITGRLVACSDPRAAGRSYWRVLALQDDAAWIRSIGDEERIDLFVHVNTLAPSV